MVVIEAEKPDAMFSDLDIGDVFIFRDEDRKEIVCLKLKEDGPGNVFELRARGLCLVNCNDLVERLDAKLIYSRR